MSASLSAIPDDLSACIGCGYNLRGLSPRGNCPECGMAIARSACRDDAWCDRQWLRRLRAAVVLLLAAVGLSAARAAIAYFTSASSLPPPLERGKAILIPLALLACAGAGWLLAARVPWAAFLDTTRWHRRVMRGFACAGALLALAALVPLPAPAARAVTILAVATGAFGGGVTLSYLADVAERLFEPGLAKASHFTLGSLTTAVLLPLLAFGLLQAKDPAATIPVLVITTLAGGIGVMLLIAVLAEFLILIREAGTE